MAQFLDMPRSASSLTVLWRSGVLSGQRPVV